MNLKAIQILFLKDLFLISLFNKSRYNQCGMFLINNINGDCITT